MDNEWVVVGDGQPQRCMRPETDLQETGASPEATEVLAPRPPDATAAGVWLDPVAGPVMLP